MVWGQDGSGESEGEGRGLESVSLALNPSKVTTALAESDLRKTPETLSHLLHKIRFTQFAELTEYNPAGV